MNRYGESRVAFPLLWVLLLMLMFQSTGSLLTVSRLTTGCSSLHMYVTNGASSSTPDSKPPQSQPQSTSKTYKVSFENPPFFPSTLEELANDAAFAAKVAIVSQILRIRMDIRLRITSRGNRFMLKWLLLTAVNLLDEEFSRIHLFIDKTDDVLKCQEIWSELVTNITATAAATAAAAGVEQPVDANDFAQKIQISSISDIDITEKRTIFLIFNPDNMISCEHPNLLEDVQALCFHAALRKQPVIMINPCLMATAWNDYGARPPLLLSDFAQAYFICDDYFMFSRRDQWAGLVQRAASGFDLFLLEGFPSAVRDSQQRFPTRYTRLQNWPEGFPNDLKSFIVRLLSRDPNFPLPAVLAEIRKQDESRTRADVVFDEELIAGLMTSGLSRQGERTESVRRRGGSSLIPSSALRRGRNSSGGGSTGISRSGSSGSGSGSSSWRDIKPAQRKNAAGRHKDKNGGWTPQATCSDDGGSEEQVRQWDDMSGGR